MYAYSVPSSAGGSCRLRLLATLLCLAFMCQLAGYVGPAWLVMDTFLYKLYVGLWFFVLCVADECIAHSTLDISSHNLDTDNFGWTEYQAEATVALIFCLVALICRLGSSRPPVLRSAAIFSLVSGILALVASGRFLDGILKAKRFYNDAGQTDPFDPPYALIVAMVGGCLSCGGSFLAMYSAHRDADQQSYKNTAFVMPDYQNPAATVGISNPGYLTVTEKTRPDHRY